MYDIYSNPTDDLCRFALGREGGRKLLVFGLNPSTATQEKADTTISKVEAVSQREGYDGFVMLNLYPVRATDFKKLPSEPDQRRIKKNLEIIESFAARQSRSMIWAAWGASIFDRSYFVTSLLKVIEILKIHRPVWLHYGPLTKGGHPRHPSRLSYEWRFQPFDVEQYQRNASKVVLKNR